MLTQHEWVEGCYAYYAENDYEPGNPEDGEWEDAHYPVPKCKGGEVTIKLLKQHHAVQGVLQSEEYQHPCIYGWEANYLEGEMLALYEKWQTRHGQLAAEALWATLTPEQRSERARKAAQHPKPGNWETATPERRQSVMASATLAQKARRRPVMVTGNGATTRYASVGEAAEALGVSHSLVSYWLAGKRDSYRARGLKVAWASPEV